MAEITYPATLKTAYDKLCAVYVLVEQMRLEHNRQGAVARSNWTKYKDKWYLYAQRPDRLGGNIFRSRLMPLLVEQNSLRKIIRDARYIEEQWRAIPPEERADVQKALYGDRVLEKDKPTQARATGLDELKAVSLDNLEGEAPPDPTEDFTAYTEVDPNSDFTVTASKIAVDGLRRDTAAYVYADKGAGHFGDFEHLLTITKGSCQYLSALGWWAVSNTAGTMQDFLDNDDGISLHSYNVSEEMITLREYANYTQDPYAGSSTGTRYLAVSRSGTTATCLIYTDSDRTSLDDTLSVTVVTTAFRYVYGVFSRESSSGSYEADGDIEDLDLQEVSETEKTAADSGAGTEAKAGYPAGEVTGVDSGNGVNTELELEGETGTGDTAAGMESSTLDTGGIVERYAGETGTGSEAVGEREIPASESGAGTEITADFPGGEITGVESGNGVDTESELEGETGTGDTAAGIESSTLDTGGIVEKYAGETGTGTEIAEKSEGKTADDSGAGNEESVIIPVFFGDDGATGLDLSVLFKDAFGNDAGDSDDRLKALVGLAGIGAGRRLPGSSAKVHIPSEKTGIPSKGVNK